MKQGGLPSVCGERERRLTIRQWEQGNLDFLNEDNALSNETAEPVNMTYKHLKRPSAAKFNLRRTPGLRFLIWPSAC